ncbi:MAG: hypothetical protein Q8K63_03115 [Acidimicrobiales bacterium]|nr:hypothetical protein [Acidimicrobiales bacterium]
MATLEDIDRQLTELRAAETAVTANLLTLEEHPAYQLLSAAKDSMTGLTAERARPALQAMLDLWQHFALLSDLVDRADDLRGTDRRLPDERIAELDHLLNGHSVPLPRRQVPLAQRGLLSVSHVEEAITPADVLTAMTNAFESARDVVVAAEAAWNKLLPALDAANNEVATLAERAKDLDIAEPRALSMARAALAPIATHIANDPLGAHDNLDAAIDGHLQTARAEIAERVAERDTVQSSLPAARQQLAAIETLLDRGASALAVARSKIKDPDGLLAPLAREQLDDPERGLVVWLARIDDLASRREWRLAARGLTQWRTTASAFQEVAQRVVDANEAPVCRRDELRGLLGASKAKASAVGLGEDGDIDGLYDEARVALYTSPCDLAVAEALVSQHLAAVRVLVAPSRREEERA